MTAPKRVRSVTRERVLEAAEKVFEAQGYRAASINKIASESGYTIGALYSNFASKADLYMALMERRMARRRKRIEEAFRAARAGDHIDALADTLGIALIPESPRNLAVFEFAAEALKDDQLRPRLLELNVIARQMLREVLLANRPEQEADRALDRLVVLTQCLLNGIAITVALDPTVDADAVLRDGIRVLLTQLLDEP